MRTAAFVLGTLLICGVAPAHAQLGALGKLKKGADKAIDAKQKYDDYNITDQEERQLGEQVSAKLRERFGVFQDAAVTKYVTLVGDALAQGSKRPGLEWTFIVLDTEGVNAYAAPGGFVHITRGLLGLMKSEAELAGVLGHEITHVTEKHTVEAIKRGKGVAIVGEKIPTRADFLARYATVTYERVLDSAYSRDDESEADKIGVQVSNKTGYAPHGLADALQKVADRNASRTEPNGVFVSHPVIKDRIASIENEIKSDKLTATAIAASRYKENITFDAKPITEISTDVEGAAGLAAGDKKKDDDKKDADKAKKDDEKKKSGFGLSSITGGKQAQNNQQVASAGARGGVPDRDAKGGPNKSPLTVKITPAELEAFKKGIAS